jgi:cell wall-associated NlpC family hydrolase
VRRTWLAGAAAAAAITVPLTAFTGTAHAASLSPQQAASASALVRVNLFDRTALKEAKKLIGDPYRYGGTSPAGFDCSGFTQYVYHHTGGGKPLQRTAQAQYHQAKRIAKSDAQPGDLVFFHETSSPSSAVYHVGIYDGGNNMVAAPSSGGHVEVQSFTWAGNTVTFGSITHG